MPAKRSGGGPRSTRLETGPTCEWVDGATDPIHPTRCGRPARAVVADAAGARHFTCVEHLDLVRARSSAGRGRSRTGRPRELFLSAALW
jgi:hypothetical protein